jgi:hypothetical protein
MSREGAGVASLPGGRAGGWKPHRVAGADATVYGDGVAARRTVLAPKREGAIGWNRQAHDFLHPRLVNGNQLVSPGRGRGGGAFEIADGPSCGSII